MSFLIDPQHDHGNMYQVAVVHCARCLARQDDPRWREMKKFWALFEKWKQEEATVRAQEEA